ncbi:hypothetical protein [uncultured Gimesia sp.]|uniref:hypothetical protein n=1 Tax=uncultured Gimesia sp. TaxID=1678688 RepID=UPI002636FF94|nr:hypothetical protein [uncultured Gimesia sp.]
MKSTEYRQNWLFYYLLVQGMAGIFWWILLFQMPESRAWFLSEQFPEQVLMSFWLPDFLILILGSFLAAEGYRNHRSWFQPVLYFLTGGISYISLYLLALSISTQAGWLGTGIMLLCTIMMLVVCYVARYDKIRKKY